MIEWEAVSNVRFVPRTAEADYLFIQPSTGNSSHVGRVGGSQVVNIFNWNVAMVMAHELGHALGLYHEQQRPDRDQYVQINTQNIDPNNLHNFAIASGSRTYGPYDFESIMHYAQNAFSINGSPTITVRAPWQCWQTAIGSRFSLSEGDALGMAARYGPGVPTFPERPFDFQYASQHTPWGFQDQDRWFPGDVNADRKTDFMLVHDDGPLVSLRVALSNGNGAYGLFATGTNFTFDSRRRWFPGDVNGDRRTDFMLVADDGLPPDAVLAVALSNGNGTFQIPATVRSPWSFDTQRPWFPGDVNGDGRTDFMMVADDGTPPTALLCVALSDGSGGFQCLPAVRSPWAFDTRRPWFPGDVNGDGRTDFMMVADQDGNSWLCVAFSEGNGTFRFESFDSGWAFFAHYRWFPGDLNGDHRTDFLLVADSGPANTVSLIAAVSNGTGTSWTRLRHETGWGWESGQRVFAADVTGDGSDDFVRIASRSGPGGARGVIQAASWQSTGSFLVLSRETIFGWSGRYWWLPGDADGDGRSDVLLAADNAPGGNAGLQTAFLRGLPALSSSVGRNCGGGDVAYLYSSRPILGRNLTLQVCGSLPGVTGQFLLSGRPAIALQLNCACEAFLDPATLVLLSPFVTGSSGRASRVLPLPDEPSILGLALRLQALLTGGSCGFRLSNGIDLVLGRE